MLITTDEIIIRQLNKFLASTGRKAHGILMHPAVWRALVNSPNYTTRISFATSELPNMFHGIPVYRSLDLQVAQVEIF